MSTTTELPPPSGTAPVADTRRYLPRAFGFLVDLPERSDGIRAFLEGTLFVAATTDRGNAIDAIGTLTMPDQEPVDFESVGQLKSVTQWSDPMMQGILQKLQKLIA